MLSVNLTEGLIGEERLPEQWYLQKIGGHGVGMEYLLEDMKLKWPLLDNPIIIMTGPLTGSPVPATSKACIISYARESEVLNLGAIEGRFPAYLKLAGFDGLVITGRAEEPVQLLIRKNGSKIIGASGLWGKDIFAAEEDIRGELGEVSTLTIGQAGENANIHASVVSDRFVNAGAGLGRDFGAKTLKSISVEGDGELSIDAGTAGFLASAAEYARRHFHETATEETRRTCFGCTGCCGSYSSQEDILFFGDDVERVQDLLPDMAQESVLKLYKECLRQGIGVFAVARSIADRANDENLHECLDSLLSKAVKEDPENCVNTFSWEEAQLRLHGRYFDDAFRETDTIDALIERENLVMVKNCIPICERWRMSIQDMVIFLNGMTGLDYSPDDLLKVGQDVIRQTMDFYAGISYEARTDQEFTPCTAMLPSVLVKNPKHYIERRGWEATGYPSQERLT